jgi:hypothetical protein
MKPRQQFKWQAVDNVSSWEEGLELVKKYTHNGQNPHAEWSRVNGGENGIRAKFKCKAHKDCGVWLCLTRSTDMSFQLRVSEKNGSVAIKHASDLQLFDRANAKVSKAMKREAASAISYGGSATDVLGKLEETMLESGEAGVWEWNCALNQIDNHFS